MSILKTKLATATPIVWSTLSPTEHLSNPGFDSDTLWTKSSFTITGGKAVYLDAAGNGSLFQATGDMAVALVAGQRYTFTYTISDSDDQGGFLFLTRFDVDAKSGFVTIPATDGTHSTDFVWPSGKNGFSFGVWSNTTNATLKIDDVSMKIFEEGVVFNGYLIATLTHSSATTFFLNGEENSRVPAVVKIPIRDGVLATDVELFQNSQVSPTGTTYTFKWYDLHDTLQATETGITLDADTETITPPALTAA